MIQKILIANRGEIALRILRACKEMNIQTVVIYSKPDEDALYVKMADESICIGPPSLKESYLNMDRIISTALCTHCDAIHPGYGFLSENPVFSKKCLDANILFIGPSPKHIEMMGDKACARQVMMKHNIPVIPGSKKATKDVLEAFKVAKNIGFPVLIKASSGGGGRGMRIVHQECNFHESFILAQSEAHSFFKDDQMYIEKYISNPKHIEFQIVADSYGNTIHLGERDCSMQRRNQKILEEAPCEKIDPILRKKMGQAAIDAAKACDYKSVGTVEFLLDGESFYFIEMNTRIQVEHPITECITGIDLIKEQIKIANGQALEYTQENIKFLGHAMEFRINAEDPDHDFLPSPGTLTEYLIPGGMGIRIDSHAYKGYNIPPMYDSMIGKLIVFGKDRNDVINKSKRALDEMIIKGVCTNISFHQTLLNHPKFIDNDYDTSFIEKNKVDKEVTYDKY